MDEETELFEKCPEFDTCSCQKCPLDGEIELRVLLPGEMPCKARKHTRHDLWGLSSTEEKAKLPKEGYTGREYAGELASKAYHAVHG